MSFIDQLLDSHFLSVAADSADSVTFDLRAFISRQIDDSRYNLLLLKVSISLCTLPGRSDSLSRFVVSDALDEFTTDQLGGGVGPAGNGLHLQAGGVTGDNGLDLVALGVELGLLANGAGVFGFLKSSFTFIFQH